VVKCLKLKTGDLILGIIIVCILGLFGWSNIHKLGAHTGEVQDKGDHGKAVVTNFATGQSMEFDLNTNGDHDLSSSLGNVIVQVADGKARISHSTCLDQICVNVFGWVESPDDISVCMPNSIMLKVVKSSEGRDN